MAQAPPHGAQPAPGRGPLAPQLQNLGTHAHKITTTSARAQRFFNQGLILAYGFNHPGAARSFREAARLDPACAMCYWGQALVLGPNINAPMQPGDERKAYELVQKALKLSGTASPAERGYIDALSKRYSGQANPDRPALDKAYADAMRKLHAVYPQDLDAATLFAEALLDLRPWNYWTRDGNPYPETQEFIPVLESVLKRDPRHPGANHYYIHAMEAEKPELAEGAADRLRDLVPGAGHLQHMPSHIYVRVGRYADASAVNVKAIAADEDYIAQCRAQGIYPLAYHPHNIHFFWWATSWEGRSRESIEAARQTQAKSSGHLADLPEWAQVFPLTPLYAYARFGKWQEILNEPQPPADRKYWMGIWLYARGLALARTHRLEDARKQLETLNNLATDASLKTLIIGANPASLLLRLAAKTLSGELAAERGNLPGAIADLHEAVLLQDSMLYAEPADWYFPVRQALGAVLLSAGRALEAETVYWEDLKRNPENGWSLFGLMRSLQAQSKTGEAAGVEQRFRKAWAHADVTLAASRF